MAAPTGPTLKFSKMQGLGNDFVVIDAITQQINLSSDHIRTLADRHYGIGCDQILLVEQATISDADFRYRIFNADGSEVSQCGNGARCFARFVFDKGLTTKKEMAVETASGMIYPRLESDGRVTVNMGSPRLEPVDIPFLAYARNNWYELETSAGEHIEIGAVSMGNPHAIIVAESIETAPVARLGPLIETHAMFPERTNVGFMEVVSKNFIKLRVFERGAGETLACGTAACAAVVVGRERGTLDSHVTVALPGGQLAINWEGGNAPVWMTGPATFVFEGFIKL